MRNSLHWNEIQSSRPIQGCVVFLHGRGTTGKDLMPLAEEITIPSLRWVFPDAPFPFPEDFGGRMWFAPPSDREEGLGESRLLLFDLLDHLIERDHVPAEQIVLMGFSQGAVMCLDVGLRFPKRLAALMALSGFLPSPEILPAEKSPASTGMPILLVHGTMDEVVRVDGSRQAYATLLKEGYAVRLQEYPMGHQVIPEEIAFIRHHLVRFLHIR
ncbi:MAG: alpha/beta hydrolase [Nitrospiria bacterium]